MSKNELIDLLVEALELWEDCSNGKDGTCGCVPWSSDKAREQALSKAKEFRDNEGGENGL